ncbi:LCP family protein [Candidatus Enterococcus murrayae]|uniref:LCP family protein n=1 Tax=Candidatus Enterococcus murrayae TaxID=2815321 RepID=A0ABS3HCP0_9ENTE|nr:LCP family protein [Enterococcus sp. MJM16]MBO0451212.1 LCP family protein [Enterococcus sp. MJM16]
MGTKRRRAPNRKKQLKKILTVLVSTLLVLILLLTAVAAKVFYDVKSTTENAYEPIARAQRLKEIDLKQQEPFSVLLLGVDTGALGRSEQGRSDTIMVATVNPKTEKTVLVSLPRDAYAEIAGHGTMDKINHAYAFGGTAMTIATVEKLLDIPINYYVTINMQGIESLVDAVGEVEVSNPFAFTYEETEFPKGVQKLDGSNALKYVRMRYDDPEGDYGRQARQRQLIAGIVKNAISFKGLSSYQEILTSLGSNIKTDVHFSDLKLLTRKYRGAFSEIESEQAKGEGFTQDEISYQRLSSEELVRIQQLLKAQLNSGV